MNDEDAFLKAISANTADLGLRQVYADWLEERGDPRAEFVRLQVQITAAPPADARLLRARADYLRSRFSPYRAALLDPPVWCVVGNIVGERAFGPGGQEQRRGTRLLRPRAKVYLAGMRHAYAVAANPEFAARIQVVGQQRKARTWILCWVQSDCVENWRVRLVHHPGSMVRLREARWPGFWLAPNEFVCPEDRQAPASVHALQRALGVIR